MTTVKQAEKALEIARTTVRQWTDKAREARSVAAELDADAGSLILAGTPANEVAVKINAADLQARAFGQAAAEAEKQVKAARRTLLEAWIAQYDRDTTKARQEYDEHKAKIDDLLAQLKELDGWDYKAADAPTALGSSYAIAHSAYLYRLWRQARNSAAYCRYSLQEEKHPAGGANLQQYGGDISWGEEMSGVMGPTPPAAVQYLAELDRERSGQTILSAEPIEGPDVDHDELDPVEDADLIAAMGGTR